MTLAVLFLVLYKRNLFHRITLLVERLVWHRDLPTDILSVLYALINIPIFFVGFREFALRYIGRASVAC